MTVHIGPGSPIKFLVLGVKSVNGIKCLNECLHGCLPCDGLATGPGCTLPPAHRLLEIGTSFPVTHYGISGIEDE
ncbi:hypothetical protein AMECASPLE_020971 [Ameca splendens]|uniref:Uncharacterized protein n=1 Tax=Ameca splendens TaxID=208324 RepID=A0ABV0ZE14_9TELE